MLALLITSLALAVSARAKDLQPASPAFDDLWSQRAGGAAFEPAAEAGHEVEQTVVPAGGLATGSGIVFVGDSHSVGQFGEAVYQRLRALAPVEQFSVCGATLNWWLDGRGTNACGYVFRSPDRPVERQDWRRGGTPPSPDRHAQLKTAIEGRPRAVIIALGANKNGDLVAPGARLMAMIPAGSRCFWISPPPVPRDGSCKDYDRGDFEPVFERIRQAAGRDCTLIDSSKFVEARRSSGCHFDNAYGAQWGRGVADEIAGAL